VSQKEKEGRIRKKVSSKSRGYNATRSRIHRRGTIHNMVRKCGTGKKDHRQVAYVH